MKKAFFIFTTNQFSDPGKAHCQMYVCVCLCVRTIMLELNNRLPRYLACWSILILPSSRSKIKIYCHKMSNILFWPWMDIMSLWGMMNHQCFDTVGWASGRAFGP